jgi:hypothetical protein
MATDIVQQKNSLSEHIHQNIAASRGSIHLQPVKSVEAKLITETTFTWVLEVS